MTILLPDVTDGARLTPDPTVSARVADETPETDDETLAERAAAGDDRAFEAIVARYQGRVFRLACRLTRGTHAPDLLQEAFLQVYRHLPSFRAESRLGAGLHRIPTNPAPLPRSNE